MRRVQSIRLLLLSSILLAVSLQMDWVTRTEDAAGVAITTQLNGNNVVPILDALLLINLATVLALLVLPWWGRALLLLASLGTGLASLIPLIWPAEDFALPPRILSIAAVVATLVGSMGAGSQLRRAPTPRQPDQASSERIDRWRALDAGDDPTVDE